MRIEPRRPLTMLAYLLFGVFLFAVSASISAQADNPMPARNAHASRYSGWECSRGFRACTGDR